MNNLAYFLHVVSDHLNSTETDKFLDKEFSNKRTNMMLKDFYNYLNHKISGIDSGSKVYVKRVEFVLNSRFNNQQLAKATGLTEDIIAKCRKDPKGHTAFEHANQILKFYETSLAKYLHPDDIKYLPE